MSKFGKLLRAWQAKLNQIGKEVGDAGMVRLADTTNTAAEQRLDAAWDEYWQVLMGDRGLKLPGGHTLPEAHLA